MEPEKIAKGAEAVAKSLKNILYKKPAKSQNNADSPEDSGMVVPDNIEDTFDRDEIYPLW